MATDRRDVWIDDEHFVLDPDEYDEISEYAGSPKRLSARELEAVLEYMRDDSAGDDVEALVGRMVADVSELDSELEPESRGFSTLPDVWHTDEERAAEADQHDVEKVSVGEARAHADHWVQVMGTGTKRKGLHVSGPESTREDPATLCSKSIPTDGELKAKDLATFPPGYDDDRICDNCRYAVAIEQLDGGGGGG